MTPAPGWYDDPERPSAKRWWDGAAWGMRDTEYRSVSKLTPETHKGDEAIRRSGWTWVAAAGVVGMAVGAVGPWAKALFASVSGLDGSNDGWFVIAVAVLAGLSLLLNEQRSGRGWLIGSLLAGLGGIAITWIDRSDVTSRASDSEGLLQVGWGLNLALIASVVVLVASLILFFQKSSQP